jgi:Mlc titration factor MtfA (ptsG expression regulator)
VVEANVPTTAELSPTERRRLSELSAAFVQDKHWEAARGFTIDDEVRVTVAAQACQLLLGFDEGLDWYRAVHTIVVHRSSQTQRGERSVGATALRTDTPRRLQGRTGPGWPVVLAWDAARRQGRVPAQGLNVVHHEFAHQLDLLDGTLDGTPPLDEQLRPRWVRVCTAAFEAVRAEPDEVLREYAGETPAEFFAVATEVFFSRPLELADHHPQLYDVLRVFYRQDPAQRRGSPARPVPGPSADGGERPPPDSSGSALIDR